MKKMTGESTNITEENLSAMRQLFPEAFEEGKFDLDVLRQLLGDYVDDEEERYSFKWNGKGRALRLSQTPSTGTLRPCKEESVDWDTTQNLYIEGDNLEVLKLLQKSYHGRVKMIYIDPPYNTGSDFVYKDDFRDNVENYKRITGQVDGEGHWISANKENRESSGRFHTDWLNMMYPRLRLARNLLADDGVIIIHMDEHEIANIMRLCTELFGEDNDLGTLVWDKRNPKGDAKGIAYQHEYILFFAKNKNMLANSHEIQRPKKNAADILQKARDLFGKISSSYSLEDANKEFSRWIGQQSAFSEGEKAYRHIDEEGRVYRGVSMAWPNKKKAPDDYFVPLRHPMTGRYCSVPERGWRNPPETMEKLLKEGLILFGKDETKQPERKYLLEENMMENIPSLLYYGGSDTNLLTELEIPFDNPKVVDICMEHIFAFTNNYDIILDFFSGSATTAHAVVQLNAEDGGNRRFIMVQLPEPTPETSEAAKAGYVNICEIGKERIRRAGKKVKAECAAAERAAALDIGFKVFKLDSSNLQKWQPQPEDLMASLEASMDNFLPDRTTLDVVYEIALKLGLELSYEVEAREVDGHTVYVIGAGALMICLDSQISMDTAEALLRLHEEYEPETWQVVFRDTGFLSDQEKTNIKETLKSAGLDEDAFISI